MVDLASTGLSVHPLCLGTNVFGSVLDRAAAFDVLDAYVEGGGNFIDTADVYTAWAPGNSGGESEEIIGAWMRERANHDTVIVATKVGFPGNPVAPEGSLKPDVIRTAVDGCLQRLGVETLDVLYAHKDDPDTPLEDTLATLDEIVRAGKARTLAASNYTAPRLREALAIADREGFARFVALQPKYNLLDRADFEDGLEKLTRAEGLPVFTYSALASGFLTGKYRPDAPLPETHRASGVQKAYMNDRGFGTLAALDRIAAEHDATVAQIALAWLMAHPAVAAPIASGTSPEQVRELLGAADVKLTDEEWRELADAAA
jgi:aryl-alcohol dehydrogenase-like predicted oxidoreductase